MITNVYSIKDNKLGVFGRPFFSENHITAHRSLAIAVQDKTIQLSFFPEEFDLYMLGEFDDQTGKIKTPPQPEFVVSAISLKRFEEKNAKSI